LSYFEQKYECSGVCHSSLFFYDLDLNEGPPVETCLKYMKEEVSGDLQYLGYTSLAVGIICMLIWVVQYILWLKFAPVKEDHPYARN